MVCSRVCKVAQVQAAYGIGTFKKQYIPYNHLVCDVKCVRFCHYVEFSCKCVVVYNQVIHLGSNHKPSEDEVGIFQANLMSMSSPSMSRLHTTAALELIVSWWRHQKESVSALLAHCAENSAVTGEFPRKRPVTRSFGVFFDLRLNNRLSKQSWGWWFETPSCS